MRGGEGWGRGGGSRGDEGWRVGGGEWIKGGGRRGDEACEQMRIEYIFKPLKLMKYDKRDENSQVYYSTHSIQK